MLNSHTPSVTADNEYMLDLVPLSELQQGELYILKIKLVAIGLFQGWDDDMCCFSILRTDSVDHIRWSEARYLPNNFDAYHAFDHAGNPPIHLWSKHLRMDMPFNWFSMFEEARQWQKQWHLDYWPSEVMDNIPPPPLEETNTSDHETPSTHQLDADDIHQDRPEEQNKPTPAMELQKQYRAALEVTQQKLEQSTIEPKQIEAEQNPIASKPPELKLRVSKSLEPRTVPQAPMEQNTLAEEEPKLKPKRSFSSFFLKKKKSKKPLRQEESKNRKSAPPTPSVIPKQYQKSLSDNTVPSTEEASVTQTPSFKPSTLGAKMELFDIDSFMDMQATFAFLNETSNIDSSFSFMNSAITHKTS